MIQEHIVGEIVDIDEYGTMTIKAGVPSLDRALLRKYKSCEIVLDDGRRISPQQRRKIYALIGEIDEYVNGIRSQEGVEEQKQFLKMEFMLNRMSDTERILFSLSDCSVTTARAFINHIIDFILKNDIPTKFPLITQTDDVVHYVMACLYNKRCAVCGKPSDLHHVDAIGAGNNRNEAHHLGRLALPLCREHHTELHQSGNQSFMEKYHLEPVKIDEKMCKIYKLKK